MAGKITVYCSMPGQLLLRNFEEVDRGIEGKVQMPSGDAVLIKNGMNADIDLDFMKVWMKANASSDLVKGKMIQLEKQEND